MYMLECACNSLEPLVHLFDYKFMYGLQFKVHVTLLDSTDGYYSLLLWRHALSDRRVQWIWYKLFTQQQQTCNITIRNSNEDMSILNGERMSKTTKIHYMHPQNQENYVCPSTCEQTTVGSEAEDLPDAQHRLGTLQKASSLVIMVLARSIHQLACHSRNHNVRCCSSNSNLTSSSQWCAHARALHHSTRMADTW